MHVSMQESLDLCINFMLDDLSNKSHPENTVDTLSCHL